MIVTTKLGRIEGEELDGVAVFRGIPYAAPPVGERRFRAPQPPAPWSGTRDGRRWGPSAPQLLSIMRDLEPQDEDCLNLNVWTPALASGRPRAPLPVLVFVHGGAFVSGAATHPMYDLRRLAQRAGAVAVSFNYRLGAFGFADFGALGEAHFAADANNGLRDQIAALRWVREHIDAFGGDPERVTVLGQSSGAMSAATLLTVDAAAGLFTRAIAQSGAAHHVTTREHSAGIARILLDGLGLGPRELGKLRELPAGAILKAQAACQRAAVDVGARGRPLHNAGMTLLPVVDGDLVRDVPIDAAARGAGAGVPLLLGTNAHEWNFWAFLADVATRDLDPDGVLRALEPRLPAHAHAASELYTAELHAQLGAPPAPWQVYCAIETDRIFTMPAVRLAEVREAAEAPTFVYRFDWSGPLFEGALGCCHTMEVPFVLGSTGDGFGRVFAGGGSEAQALSERMMDAWIAFARDADPSTDALGSWPRYDTRRRAVLGLQREPRTLSAPSPAVLQFWADLI